MYSVVGADGQVYGPVDLRTVQRWVGEGRVVASTMVIDEVTGRRAEAQSVLELAGLFPAAGPSSYGGGYGGQAVVSGPGSQGGYGQGSTQHGSHGQYGQGQYGQGQPYGQGQYPVGGSFQHPPHPGYGTGVGGKSKIAAALLALFLGGIGIHRFYLGYTGSGVAMLLITFLTCGFGVLLTCIWAFVDMILILTGSLRDSDGMPLV